MDRAARYHQLRKTRQERDAARQQAKERRQSMVDPLYNLVGSGQGSHHSEVEATTFQRQARIEAAESRAEAVVSEGRSPVVRSLDASSNVANPISEADEQYRNHDTSFLLNLSTAKARRVIQESRQELKACLASQSCFEDGARALIHILRRAECVTIDQSKVKGERPYIHEVEPPRRPSGEDGKLVAEAVAAIEGNITSLEAAIYADDRSINQAAMELLSYLLIMGDDMQRRLADATVKQHAKQITDLGKERCDYSIAHIIGYSRADVADHLSSEIIARFMAGEFRPFQIHQLLRSEMSEAMPESSAEQARIQIKALLESYGMNYEELLPIWKEAAPDIWREDMVALRNVSAIYELEQSRPGASARLFRRFGIAVFDRYPVEVLVDQDVHADDKDIPYGTVTYARKDQGFMEGAMYEARPVLKSIAEQLMAEGFHIRIIEAAGPMSLAKRHIALDECYGSHQLMSFGLQFAHGEPGSMGFGKNPAGVLQERHVEGKTARRVLRCYVPHAEISVVSCSTGKEGGIVQTLSNKATQQFTAPSHPVTLYKADAEVTLNDEGLPRFKINYRGGNQNTFSAGKLQD